MIRVTTEPARQLVRAVMSGMLTIDEVDRFSQDEQAAVQATRAVQAVGLAAPS